MKQEEAKRAEQEARRKRLIFITFSIYKIHKKLIICLVIESWKQKEYKLNTKKKERLQKKIWILINKQPNIMINQKDKDGKIS